MKKFPRGTILKLTCDIHEFLSKAPKVYEDLIDIIDEDGTVKVKTHQGDYVGLYGMKVKIHARFIKQFVDVTPEIEVPAIKLDDGHMEAIDEQVASLGTPEVFIEHEAAKVIIEQRKNEVKEKHGALTSEPVEYTELKSSLFNETVNSLATAAAKLNSLGYEFSDGEWLSQEEIKEQKLATMTDKVYDMTAVEVAQLLIDNNIEL